LACLQTGWSLIKDKYWLFVGITGVGILIGSLGPMAILLGPMMCGIYLCLFARLRGESVSFELLFKGFDHFAQSFIATLIQIIPASVLLVPAYIIFFIMFMGRMKAMGARPRGAPADLSELYPLFIMWGAMILVVILVSALAGAFFIFTYPLIVDRRLQALDAIKTSIRAAMANLGGVLGLLGLNMVLGIIGLMLCYVGAIALMPISFASWAVAYRQVFPAER
jgi:uncharacterized membrane protein